ncbi:LLM class F420-dependent oxidoreductase [Sphaerisporangium siamense]|uniref:F420-dependent oxidoreductase-like protein n=1 Tax=Sphaerisporangium siamense TaxID=795645 RepID=A0A7W7D330_9ACTN|nr:LLM class F420-dependent oxidoreductase [Sphaerisporangium siamense]MBB4699377.1 F420-dependent oxidoreductase-like protein [Sphaerisporangium siamense]GII89288.1 LLM class F420-dependent oxidoreductase [Sphaerisporangium siamense]
MIDKLACSIYTLGADAAEAAEAAGYESGWTSESYGTDSFTPLAWWGAKTRTMRLGTGVAQMAARAPTATAMAAMTLDRLSGGRVVVGMGLSGPQVVEGWYGMPFERPLRWTREYIAIMRDTFKRERVAYDGEIYKLPVTGGTGLGRSIRPGIRDARTDIPIHLGAEGPKNISLAAEIADGWLPTNFSPEFDHWYRERLEIGFSRRPGGRPENFEVAPGVAVAFGPDVETAADELRPGIAFQVAANGAEGMNFHYNSIARLGFEEPCKEIVARFKARDRAGMAAAVPTEMVEAIALVGPPEKVQRDLETRWHDCVATTLIARTSERHLPVLARVFAASRAACGAPVASRAENG